MPQPPGMGGGGTTQQPADRDIDANGNAFVPGSLGFDPDDVRAHLGALVRWTNRDCCVPHTATEDNGLWRLTGTYGEGTPFVGIDPGESRERNFDAGTFFYHCEVHGSAAMSGVVRVRDRLRLLSGGDRVRARWGFQELPAGQVFDVQRKRGGGDWMAFVNGTRELSDVFAAGAPGTVWRVRSRVRKRSNPAAASDYSPAAKIVIL